MRSELSGILEVVIFLLLFAGGIISDIAKKNKAKKIAEEIERAEARRPSSAAAAAPAQSAAPKPRQAQPPKKAAAPKPARADDPEWLATLADRKRREANKTAEKAAAAGQENFEPDVPGILLGRLREPQQPPLALSAEQAKSGVVLAEILGPPVSMR